MPWEAGGGGELGKERPPLEYSGPTGPGSPRRKVPVLEVKSEAGQLHPIPVQRPGRVLSS